MDLFTQKKLLIRIIILLIALNLLSLGAFLWKNCSQSHPPENCKKIERGDVSGVLKKELNLNENQFIQVTKLRNLYFQKENIISEAVRSARDSMNQLMYSSKNHEALIVDLAQKVAEKEFQMEMLRFEQAKALKTICTPEQMEKFERLVKEIRDYFKPENSNKRKEK